MFLMDYPSIRGEDLPDYSKTDTWNILHAYIDAHSQSLIEQYPRDGVQAISILQCQCANITFAYQSRYYRLFQKVINKGEESEINYIKIF